MMPYHLLVVAGGSGVRAGGDIPKQYRLLDGVSVLRRTLDAFVRPQTPAPESIRVAINPKHMDWYAAAVQGFAGPLDTPVAGGADRDESVRRGVESFESLPDEAIILVHDAARPFVRPADIGALLACFEKGCAAATLATPVADTLRRTDGQTVGRTDLWAVQTPQAFRLGLLRRAHRIPHGSFTDDAGRVATLGEAVEWVASSPENFKITTADDFALAERMIKSMHRTEFRMGSGFDVHAFDPDGRVMRLCGVAIDGPPGLKGHSDADVGLHALTDALLGTIGAGDIGTFFPPSDPQWKGADSRVFIAHALSLVGRHGGRLVNADITFIGETPRIAPHRSAMQSALSEILRLPPERIGIKATTTEGLGFTGRREGLAAQAVVSIEFST